MTTDQDNDEFFVYNDINIKDLVIYINNYCNKHCIGCYVLPEKQDINPEWIQWCLDNFEIKKTIIVGGEPTLSPVLPDVLKMLKDNGVLVTLSTNSKWVRWKHDNIIDKKHRLKPDGETLKTYKDLLDDVFSLVDSVQISIEGDEPYNDSIRGSGSFNDSLVALSYLKYEMGKDVFLRATYSYDNMGEVDKLLRIAERWRVHIHFFPYKGNGKPSLSSERQEWFYKKLIDYTESVSGDDIKNNVYRRLALAAIPQYYCYMGEPDYCPAGRNRINILPDGMVTPCEMNMPPDCFILARFKNNDKNSGEDLMDKSFLLSRCRYFLESIKKVDTGCYSCRFHRVCRGGCHMTNEHDFCPLKNMVFDHGGYVASGERCVLNLGKVKGFNHVLGKRIGC